MRTTLTLDEDVATRIEQMRKAGRGSLKDLINEALRAGLDQMAQSAAPSTRPYRITPHHLGRKLADLDNIGEILAHSEEEAWR